MTPLSVNEAISRLDELEGRPVIVSGMLGFESVENMSLYHTPRSEAQEGFYQSSIQLAVASGMVMKFDAKVCERWYAKIVTVEGIIHKRNPNWFGPPAILFAQDMYRNRSLRFYSS